MIRSFLVFLSFFLLLAHSNYSGGEEKIHALHRESVSRHRAGDNDAALRLVEEAIEICGDEKLELLSFSRSNLYNTKGVIHRAKGETSLAIESFQSAHGDSVNALYNLANTYHYDVYGMDPRESHLRISNELYGIALEKATTVNQGEVDISDDMIVMLMNDYAICLKRVGDSATSVSVLLQAVEMRPDDLQSRGNLVIALKDENRLTEAIYHSKEAIRIDPRSSQVRHNYGLVLQQNNDHKEAVNQWKEAILLDPLCSNSLSSLGHQEGAAGNLEEARRWYRLASDACESKGEIEELDVLKLMIATAVVPIIYKSNEDILSVRRLYEMNLRGLLEEKSALVIRRPELSIGSGSLGYYLVYQGFNDVELRRLLARVYWKASPSLGYVAPFLLEGGKRVGGGQGKVRVGFHSAFFYHHSVGLLTQGVICGIDRSLFHVVVFNQDRATIGADSLSNKIRACADEVVDLPDDLDMSRRIVGKFELDVLVFTEIGMDSVTYFLAFAKLARRSLMFWGHAITSGITGEDNLMEGGVGGVDYFVSSELFEVEGYEDKYTEKVYMMKGLTTYFEHPVSPREGVGREFFELPADGNMYLCPQTLYKLHPDFDRLIVGILDGDADGFVVFPHGAREEYTKDIMQRLAGDREDLLSRIFFVRRMEFDEFIRLAEIANVVLDPFPVGGGRSSLEIFSVGTPVVMFLDRTSILQLTFGMYKIMGIEDCVCRSYEQYVEVAVRVGRNREVERELRGRILERKGLLYENDEVLVEWNLMLWEMGGRGGGGGGGEEGSLILGEEFFDVEVDNRFVGYDYAMKLVTAENQQLTIRMLETDDPIVAAQTVAAQIDAEPVKFRWLAAVFQHGLRRLGEVVVRRFGVEGRGVANGREEVEVRFGDDLALVATYYGLKFSLNHRGIDLLLDKLRESVGGADGSDAWIQRRRALDYLGGAEGGGRVKKGVPAELVQDGCYLTIATTTCKRLNLFEQTMTSLVAAFENAEEMYRHVCKVIVVDDSSSEVDRARMIKLFPDFHFVFKKEELRGHANSMNLIVDMVETRYLLYLEDDFLILGGGRRGGKILQDAMAVLTQQGSNQEIAQVLLNDQSSRMCAYAEPMNECDAGGIGSSGWRRKTPTGVEYIEHEFGVVYQAHAFSYWPGFSLNPGIWDLKRIKSKMGEGGFRFDPSDDRFEQTFSMKAHDAGLTFAHLPKLNVKHIGTVVSSYTLQGLERPWD